MSGRGERGAACPADPRLGFGSVEAGGGRGVGCRAGGGGEETYRRDMDDIG